MKRFTILLALTLTILAAPLAAQEKTAAPAPAAAGQSGIAVPAEMQELLADRDLLSAEIERIINAEGDAVKIPVSLRTLSARREAKTARFLAWLDAQKIPRDWSAKGWRLDKWVFILPPAASSSSPSNEAKKPEASKP